MRPGGRFALFDTVAGPNQPLIFPVPWADDASYSFLLPSDEMRAQITAAGFAERTWEDGKELGGKLAALAPIGPLGLPPQPAAAVPPLTPGVFMGSSAPLKMGNAARNTQEGRTVLAIGVFERV